MKETVAAGPKELQGKTANENRRKHNRLSCDGFAEVMIPDSSLMFRGRIRDLSPTGCYIETRAALPKLVVGAAAELFFTVNGRSVKALAEAKAIRPGAGVGFEIHILTAQTGAPNDLLALIDRLELTDTGPRGAGIKPHHALAFLAEGMATSGALALNRPASEPINSGQGSPRMTVLDACPARTRS